MPLLVGESQQTFITLEHFLEYTSGIVGAQKCADWGCEVVISGGKHLYILNGMVFVTTLLAYVGVALRHCVETYWAL
jgi:hypothetical protein